MVQPSLVLTERRYGASIVQLQPSLVSFSHVHDNCAAGRHGVAFAEPLPKPTKVSNKQRRALARQQKKEVSISAARDARDAPGSVPASADARVAPGSVSASTDACASLLGATVAI